MRWSSPSTRVKNEEGTTIVAADGGLALTVKTEDSLPFPPGEEDEGPTQGYQLNENEKDVKIEPEQPNPDDSYVFFPVKPYAHPPIIDQMPTDQRIALIIDSVNYLADNMDTESQEMLQNMLKAVHNFKTSKSASSASSSSKPAQPAWPACLANFEGAPPADAAMGDAAEDSPAKLDEANKVDLEEDGCDFDFNK